MPIFAQLNKSELCNLYKCGKICQMIEQDPEHAGELPIINVGEPLPGLIVDKALRPEGLEYWDQVVPSPFGGLYYAVEQFRDAKVRWVNDHGEVKVTVESGSGIVLDIDTNYTEKHDSYESWFYSIGISKHLEIKKQLRKDFPR